ncbi:MAG: hypothetical protein GY737_10575, partial [Desulfobacteraceae bacterium]|nr:hypothetical protein [Desulfobacteraceae bacterium]
MEARTATTAIGDTAAARGPWTPARHPRTAPPASPVAKDPFSLGYRYRAITTADGREDLEQVPLTEEDLIYPQEGDHVSQAVPHFSFLH